MHNLTNAKNKNETFILIVTFFVIFLLLYYLFDISPWITFGAILAGLFYIRLLQGQYLGNGLQVTHKHFYRIKQIVEEQAKKLHVKEPNVFIYLDPYPNAFTIGYKSPYTITLTSSLVDSLTEEELEAVIAHEMGHVKFNHSRVSSIVSPAGQNIFLLSWIFGFWQRSSEYTADRVSLLISENPRAMVTALVKIGIGQNFLTQIDEEELLVQSKEVQHSFLNKAGEWLNNHPYLTNRVNRILLFAGENGLPYKRGGVVFCTNCGEKNSVTAHYCQSCGTEII